MTGARDWVPAGAAALLLHTLAAAAVLRLPARPSTAPHEATRIEVIETATAVLAPAASPSVGRSVARDPKRRTRPVVADHESAATPPAGGTAAVVTTALAQAGGGYRGDGGGSWHRGEVAGVTGVITGPRLLHQVDSESFYPPQAKRLGIEGTVEAILRIDAQGGVLSVDITKRAGHGFDDAAAAALKQFRFQPASGSDGRAVPSRITWKYVFLVRD